MMTTEKSETEWSPLLIEEAQTAAIQVLDEFDSFCRCNGIKYYLIGGALIGAIRSGDLVPWDDDIDVAMKRDDFERFCKEYKDSDRYALLTYKRANNYRHGMAKLVDRGTLFIEPTARDDPYGVFVDIFPLDYIVSDDAKAFASIARSVKIYNYAHVVSPEATKGNAVNNSIRALLTATHGRTSYAKALENLEKRMIHTPTPYLANYWGAWGARECGPAEWFDDSIEVSLRGRPYLAPKGFHEWLTKVYGDYMTPPKNPPHYHGKAYKLSNEKGRAGADAL